MATIDENFLIANGLAALQGNNELHCWICPMEFDSDNWKAHIDDPSHVSALRQFNRVFVANGDKIRCKACNMIIDWEALRNHAAWHRIIPWYVNGDRDKIFFENRTLRWESRYYCFLCDAIFVDRTNASVHIGEEKHQNLMTLIPPIMDSFKPVGTSYESLISEGFVPWGKTTVKCRICNCPNVILTNIAQHIEACEHVNAKLILTKKLEARDTTDAPEIGENSNDGKTAENQNQCTELQENENFGTRYNSQQSPRSISPVIDNESSEKPMNPEKSDQMKFHSQISRSLSLPSSSELLSSSDCHETTSEPVMNNTANSSSDGNPRFRSASNCEIRRKSVDSEANASMKNQCAELQENENSTTRYNSQQSPRSISPVIANESLEKPMNLKKSDQMKFHTQISRSPSLPSSSELLSSSDCHEAISELVTINTTDLSSDGNPRFRSALNSEIRRKSVDSEANSSTKNQCAELHENENSRTRHNSEKSSRYSQDSQKFNTEKFKDTEKNLNGNNVKIPSHRDSSNFPVVFKDKGRYCIICDIYVTETIDEHVASEKHLSLFYSFGPEFISPIDNVKFRCKACSYVLPNIEHVYLHIKGAKHRSIITEERKKSASEPKEINVKSEKPKVSQNATKKKMTSLKINFPLSSQPVTNSARAKSLLADHLVKYNSHHFFCRLCNDVVYDVIVDYHLMADAGHEAGSIMFKADFIVENKHVFRCRPCKLVIVGRDSLYHHVHTPAHRMAHIEGCRLSLPEDVPLSLDNEPLELYSKSTDRSNNWIVNLNRRDYACKICHLLLSDHSTIGEHLNSPRHISWVAFYSNKEPLEDEKFDCESCDCAIPNFADVFEHTMSTTHSSSSRLPIKNYSSLELTDFDRETLRCAFIAPVNNVAYMCRICNVFLEDYSSVEGHTRGDLHTKTFIKYGCEKINLVIDNKSYYCAWCRCEIRTLSRVYIHLVGKVHLENVMIKRQTILNDLGDSIKNQKVTKIISPVMGSASSEKPMNPETSEEMISPSILFLFLLIALYSFHNKSRKT